jgi:hypothetical protein
MSNARILKSWAATFGVISLLAATVGASPQAIHDDFDDGVLDEAWEIALEFADGWTYTEEGTNLAVTDIDPEIVNPNSGGTWASIYLRQETEPLGDFALTFRLAWDSQDSQQAMQMCQVLLLDDCGNLIVVAGYSDTWVGHRGQIVGHIEGDYASTGADTTPYAGDTELIVTRTGGDVAITMDGTPLNSGTCHRDVVAIQLRFAFYGYSGGGGPSFFGTEWVDLVSLDGDPADPPVVGDLDCDRIVDGADLGLLLGAWGECADPGACPADLNGDGTVNGADLGLLLGNWG